MKTLNFKRGFTLLELLVVIAIIAILSGVIFAALNSGRLKGIDAGIKSNLANTRTQAEVFYNTNTAAPDSYTNVCTNGAVGGVQAVGALVLAAARVYGLSSYNTNSAGSGTTATCNHSAGAWAAEVPLKSGGMWCVDSTNKSLQEPGTSFSASNDYTCM